MTSTRSHTAGKYRQRTAGACAAAALVVAGAVGSGPYSQVENVAVPSHPLGADQVPVAGQVPVASEPGVGMQPPPAGMPEPVAPRIQLVAAYQSGSSAPSAVSATGIPTTALAAYTNAAAVLARRDPSCGLPWSMLAGIGRVESNHGRFGGATLGADGYPNPPIRGIPLDGRPGVALIRATDGGKWTGDPVFERAVGPMQFIPSTWRAAGADGNGDGTADPNNIHDAALAAAGYLCSGGGDLRSDAGARAAVFRYNHSASYVATVLSLARDYEHGISAQLPADPVGTVSEPGRVQNLPPASVTVVDPQRPATAPAAPSVDAPAPPHAGPAAPAAPAAPVAARPAGEKPVAEAAAPAPAVKPAPPVDTQPSPDIKDTIHAAICEMAAKLPGTAQEAVKRATATVLRRHKLKPVKQTAIPTCRAAAQPSGADPDDEGTPLDEPGDPSAHRRPLKVSKTED
ncbi:lytic transglycosylase domain-containing protein [Amycolatopsis alba]|uniref:lytic transglycosylase domain-containing protein n=1 Tax=Amycolatopsis alba TaxID=76020 RepID=UPI00035FB23D|nr:lytic transglycosylase domain-containing protein [Amycolatopsis alba]